jgi:protein O-mannosyl-transferase
MPGGFLVAVRPRTTDLIWCSLATLAGGAVYLNALHNPFVYDDYRSIVDNGTILTIADVRAVVMHDVTRPLVNLSYAVDAAIWGSTPFGFHLTSVVLHMINVALLFGLARRLVADARGGDASADGRSATLIAFVSAAAFAVHPLMTEAVGYISARSEVLCGTMFFLAFLSARRWMRGGGAPWWILTLLLWLASVVTRELAAVLPFALFAYDRLLLGGGAAERRRRFWMLHVPLASLSLAAASVRIAVFAGVEHPGAISLRWSSILDEAIVCWRYVALFVDPSNQAIYHAFHPVGSLLDPRGLLALIAAAAVFIAAWRGTRIDPLVRFGAVWFFLLVAPPALLALLGYGDAMAEHRVYVAGCGLFLAAGSAVGSALARLRWMSRPTRVLTHALVVVALLSLSARTVVRNLIWGDPVSLWLEATMLASDDPLPHTVLAEVLDQSGRYAEAEVEYRTALHLNPAEPSAYVKLAVCLAVLHRFDEARAVLAELRGTAPESALLPAGEGAVALMSGQPDQARALLAKSVAKDPRDIMARQWLALLEEQVARDPAAALRLCEEIQQLAPGRVSSDDCIRRNRARLAALQSAASVAR